MDKKVKNAYKKYKDILIELENNGNPYNLYTNNLNYLLESKTKEVFLKRYKIQLDEGYNSIEFDEINQDTIYLSILSLDELKYNVIDTAIDYVNNYIEELIEEE